MTKNTEAARQFRVGMEQFGALIPKKALAVQQALALKGLRGLSKKSPVDTGAFRGNMQVVIGLGDAPPIDRKDKRRRGTTTGAEVMAVEEAKIKDAKPFGAISIVNALPYAERIENGWSQQAPSGVFALTAAELQAEIIDTLTGGPVEYTPDGIIDQGTPDAPSRSRNIPLRPDGLA